MNKRIIFPNDDGGVSVLIPAPQARATLVFEAVYETEYVEPTDGGPGYELKKLVTPEVSRPETDDEFLARIAAKDVPAGKPFKIVDVSEIPTDRTERDAWEWAE